MFSEICPNSTVAKDRTSLSRVEEINGRRREDLLFVGKRGGGGKV